MEYEILVFCCLSPLEIPDIKAAISYFPFGNYGTAYFITPLSVDFLSQPNNAKVSAINEPARTSFLDVAK